MRGQVSPGLPLVRIQSGVEDVIIVGRRGCPGVSKRHGDYWYWWKECSDHKRSDRRCDRNGGGRRRTQPQDVRHTVNV